MKFEEQQFKIIESIFESYFDYSIRNPSNEFKQWSKNKNARKKLKTLKLYSDQNGQCFHCEEIMQYDGPIYHPLKTSLDRIIPGSKGGNYKISNIVLSCMTCNKTRGNKSIEEFQKYMEKKND